MAGHRRLPGTEEIIYGGRRYRRHPQHEDLHRRRYFMATTAPRTYLHRDVYEDSVGPIPAGWHVHHADHDTNNNAPANLVALDPIEHARHHGESLQQLGRECGECGRLFAAFRPWARWCSPACKERYRRAAGLATPSQRKGAMAEARSCDECGSTFSARKLWARFCAPACKQRAGRRKRAGEPATNGAAQ